MMRHAAVYTNNEDKEKALNAIRTVLGQFENLFKNLGDVQNGFTKQIPLNELEGREQYDPDMLTKNLLFGNPEEIIRNRIKAPDQNLIKTKKSDFFVFGQENIVDFDNSINSFVGCCSLGTGHLNLFMKK